MLIGVVNFLIFIICVGLLGYCTRAYLLLGLLPQVITSIYVELVGSVLFVDVLST